MDEDAGVGDSMRSTEVSQLPLRERVGISIDGSDPADAIARVQQAEKAGARQVWMTVGGAGRTDTLTVLAAAAAMTSRIRLGTSIVPVYPRHPLVMIQQALAIDGIGPGRFRLGLGVSHHQVIEGTYGLPMPSPLSYIEEYVSLIRAGLSEGKVEHHGRFFNVTSALPRKAKIPVLMSALGTKAFHVAGEVADGAISWVCPPDYLVKKALPALRAGADELHRPAPPLVAQVPVALSTDAAAVRAVARQRLEGYAKSPFYANMFAAAGLPVGKDGADVDAVAESIVLSGDRREVRQRVEGLLDSGLEELLFMLLPIKDEVVERQQLLELIASL